MPAQKMAEVLERLADAINAAADNLRDAGDGGDYADQPEAAVGREVDDDNYGHRDTTDRNTSEATMLAVPAGDLWRLVNRTRKMIRLAREGKIPDMDKRAPLCRAIKALKQQGLVRKPYDLRD